MRNDENNLIGGKEIKCHFHSFLTVEGSES